VAGAPHDCWTTTEEALTAGLSDELRDAWERLRAFAVALGEQRIYASHHSIMFSHKHCHFFVRPRPRYLEVCFFLPRRIADGRVLRAVASSKTKTCHTVRVVHRDEVEAPITDWLREAFTHSLEAATRAPSSSRTAPAGKKRSPTPAAAGRKARAAAAGKNRTDAGKQRRTKTTKKGRSPAARKR
jgi:hypothetical protein